MLQGDAKATILAFEQIQLCLRIIGAPLTSKVDEYFTNSEWSSSHLTC